jgi:excisionase family DNA binding protein
VAESYSQPGSLSHVQRIIGGMSQSDSGETMGRFLTVTDAAELLSVSVAEIHALVLSGELPAIQVGSRALWRIEHRVLESYIDARYEESRRASLWNQSDFANIPELSGSRMSVRPVNAHADARVLHPVDCGR